MELLMLNIALAASGVEVYRCEQADGQSQFQDQPCAEGTGTRIEVDAPEPGTVSRLPARTFS